MKYLRRLSFLVLVIATLVAVACTNPLDSESDQSADSPVEEESDQLSELPTEAQSFVSLMNDHRESKGLARLEWNSDLGDVAQAHSQDMKDRCNLDSDFGDCG